MVFDSVGTDTKKNQIGFGLKKGGAIPPPPGPDPTPGPSPSPINPADIVNHHLFLPVTIGILSFIALIVLFICCRRKMG